MSAPFSQQQQQHQQSEEILSLPFDQLSAERWQQEEEYEYWSRRHRERQQQEVNTAGYTPSQPELDANPSSPVAVTTSTGSHLPGNNHNTNNNKQEDWQPRHQSDYSGYPYSAPYNNPSYTGYQASSSSSTGTSLPAAQSGREQQSQDYTAGSTYSPGYWYQPPVPLLPPPAASSSNNQTYLPYSPTHPETHAHVSQAIASTHPVASTSNYFSEAQYPNYTGYGEGQLPAYTHQSSGYYPSAQTQPSYSAQSTCVSSASGSNPNRYQPISAAAQRGGQTRLDAYATDLAYYENPKCTWAEFLVEWAALLSKDPSPSMQRSTPTFAEVEELCSGLGTSGYRVTVEKLKGIIRGINTVSTIHLKLSGTKAQLIASISSHLRRLAASHSAEYYSIAKLVGEAQGYTYPATAAAGLPNQTGVVAGASAAGLNTSNVARQPQQPYQNGYGTAGGAATTNGHTYSNTGANGTNGAGPSNYASRPQDFMLSRSPAASYSRSPSSSNAPAPSYGNSYNAQNGRLHVPHAPNGAIGSSQRAGYPGASSTNANIPTSWPARLPPKPAGLAGQAAVPMNFKQSPFYKIVQAVSTVHTLHRASQGDRGSVQAPLYITEDQRQKLVEARTNPRATQFQLRLFCTSAEYYNPNNTFGYTPHRQGIPIEFPSACEAKVNECTIPGSLKGIKKKPGTAPPANVTAAKFPSGHARAGQYALRLENASDASSVAVHYANTDKQYYMIVYLVEYTTVDTVADRIRENKVRTKEEVIKSLQRQADDPDIQATSQTISFKDPLAYVPLTIPIRGLHCQHIQCFDAKIFLEMMESTPTWLCPSCNRTINPDDLVLDGFTRDLMEQVPSSVETVIIETDGTWRSEDNKYGNSVKAIEARAAKAAAATENGGRAPSAAISVGTGLSSKAGTPFDIKPDVKNLLPDAAGAGGAKRHGKGRVASEVIDLDDEDEDDTTPPPPSRVAAAQAAARPAAAARAGGKGGVIDLTLSDDDDDDDGSSSVAIVRRPTSSNTTAANKRRVDSDWEDGPAPSSQRQRTDY